VILLILAPAGIWAGIKYGSRDALLIVGIYVLLYSAANVAFFICDRYRYPVWPAMAALGGGAITTLFELFRARRKRELTCLAGSMILLAVLSLHNWFGAQLPSFARDYLFRSLAWYQRGQFRQALTDVDQSVALDPLDGNALHHRANVLFALNQLEDARLAYQQTLKQIPEEASAWNNLGATLDRLGRTEEALEAYRKAMTCNPPSRNAYLGAAFIEIRMGKITEATGDLNALEKLANDRPDPAILATRSVIERRNGNTRRADELEQKARQIDADTTAWAIQSATQKAP
jgi:tetratricopeptide (TPR) repeat protein